MLSHWLEKLISKPEEAAVSDEERMRIATCVLLLEVAGADNEFSPDECSQIIEILRKRFDLTQDESEELIQAASERREESFDIYRYTRHINDAYAPHQRIELIEEIWRVIYADGKLDGHEDYLVHKLARLLNLSHPDLIQAKLRVAKEFKSS